jgi:beta-lactamase regulating signal transducer with metallopeptidase domain
MRFWLLALAVTMSSFALLTMGASAVVVWFTPALARRFERYAPAVRARLLFRLRIAPAALGMIAAFAIALPIYLVYEPRESEEGFATTLVALAVLGVALFAGGAWRAVRAWYSTRVVRREWESRGRRLDCFDTPLPVFAIDEQFPTVAVVGVTKPALFVAERVLAECTADEVRAMLRHEAAHVTVRDNLKRFLIRACPDVLRSGGNLDRAWSIAAEEAADAAAVADRPATAVELAEALIRVARLATPRTPELASAFYLGGSIESRIRRLVGPESGSEAPTPLGCVMITTGALCFAALVFTAAPIVHQVMEAVVRTLP